MPTVIVRRSAPAMRVRAPTAITFPPLIVSTIVIRPVTVHLAAATRWQLTSARTDVGPEMTPVTVTADRLVTGLVAERVEVVVVLTWVAVTVVAIVVVVTAAAVTVLVVVTVGPASIVQSNSVEPVPPVLSAAVTVTVQPPATDGVPEISPLDDPICRPGGRLDAE